MSDTSKTNARQQFESLASSVAKANSMVGVVAASKTVSASVLSQIRREGERGLLGNTKILQELNEAEAAVNTNPLVRHKWLEDRLTELAMQEYLDPALAFRIVGMAISKTMPDKKTETHPFLTGFERYDAAQKHLQEVGASKHARPLVLPRVFYTEGGKLRMDLSGPRFYAPTLPADLESYFKIRKILETVEASVVVVLNDHFIFDLALAAEWIVKSFPHAEVVGTGRLENRKFFKKLEEGRYERAYGKKMTYRAYTLSPSEHLLLPDNDRNRERNQAVLARLEKIAECNELLRKGELNIDVSIIRQLQLDDQPVIAPEQFLEGEAGRTAVRVNWKHKDGHVDAHLLLERRADGSWRVLFYNHAAAEALLCSKFGQLRFTWFSMDEIPGHLTTALRKGRFVQSPEDLGLTEEDFAPTEEPAATDEASSASA